VRRFAVANSMHITKKGIVYASVRADDLQVDGILEGDALALGAARLTKKSRVKGNLRATSLDLELGASFVGHLAIGRDQVPELEALASVATLPGTSGGAAGAPR
jgi:cytoskeletal protein CcmA (bactofilin family)